MHLFQTVCDVQPLSGAHSSAQYKEYLDLLLLSDDDDDNEGDIQVAIEASLQENR